MTSPQKKSIAFQYHHIYTENLNCSDPYWLFELWFFLFLWISLL